MIPRGGVRVLSLWIALLVVSSSSLVGGFTILPEQQQQQQQQHRERTFASSPQVSVGIRHQASSTLSSTSLECNDDAESNANTIVPSRRNLISLLVGSSAGLVSTSDGNNEAQAAPPIAVIAEELGYFPVTNKDGEMRYVPQRVKRQSSEQAIELARKLSKAGAVMYGAFWCPHCARQKELFGREAWSEINYVECSPKGWGSQPLICNNKNVDGYPTWIFKDKTVLGGERELDVLANKVNFSSFRPDLEQNVPPPLGSTACKQQ